MYLINMKPVLQSHGAFTMEPKKIIMKWSDFSFTREQAMTFAAVHELDVAKESCGLLAPIFSLVKHRTKIAA
jgi:hypothetical protein